ncbi:MAG: hypothetical protein ACXAC7_08135 [Candidatus Hodarchaeales archaeon]|jgi:hypothetical protein
MNLALEGLFVNFGIEGLIFSLVVSLGPFLIILALYWIIRILRKGTSFEKFLSRLVMGYAIFTLFYVFIPATINQINPPEDEYLFTRLFIDLDAGPSGIATIGFWEASINSFVRYWGQMIINLVFSYLFYPITLLPVIFILGALLSFLILLYQLKGRSPDKSFIEKIALIQYEYEDNPIDQIKERLINPNWENARALLKILLAVLPISLYLLMTLLKVSGFQEKPNILQGTSLGWFLELFFVYLASLMFAVHLLFSGKFSFEGKYLGEKLRNTMIQSLSTVGGLISAIAIVLFVIDYQDQLFVVLYFIAYFIMVSLFFVLFLDIFETVSIYLVTIMVETLKNYTTPFITVAGEAGEESTDQVITEEIFVPSIDFDDLMGDSKEKTEEKVTEEIIELAEEEIKEEEEVVLYEEEPLTLKQSAVNDVVKGIIKISFGIILLFLFSFAFNWLFKNYEIIQSLFDGTDVRVFGYIVVSIILGVPIIITAALFSRRVFNATLLVLAFHSILPILDWSFRFVIIRFFGTHKFGTVPYVNAYFTFFHFVVIFVLAVSLLMIRRWNWNSFSNVGIIYLIGIFFVFTYGFVFLSTNLSIFPNIKLVFSSYNIGILSIFVLVLFAVIHLLLLQSLYPLNSISKMFNYFAKFVVINVPFFIVFLLLFWDSSFLNKDFQYLESLQVLGHPTETYLYPLPTFNPLFTALVGAGETWVTFVYRPIVIKDTNMLFYLPAMSEVQVNFVPLLGILSLPFKFIQPFSIIMLYGLLFFFIGREFLTVAFKEEDLVEKVVYSERNIIPSLDELIENPMQYAVVRNFGFNEDEQEGENEGISEIEENIYQLPLGPIMVEFIGEAPVDFDTLVQDTQLSLEEIHDFFLEISKTVLAREKPFIIFMKEFGYSYEEPSLDSLHIMMRDGRSVFTHQFAEESAVEPALVSGLFSAITSFAQEAVRSEELLRTIDHGDVVLQIEYGQFVFGAIFSDKNSLELRNKLYTFLNTFEEKHFEELAGWLGDTSPFADGWMLVNEIFEIE